MMVKNCDLAVRLIRKTLQELLTETQLASYQPDFPQLAWLGRHRA